MHVTREFVYALCISDYFVLVYETCRLERTLSMCVRTRTWAHVIIIDACVVFGGNLFFVFQSHSFERENVNDDVHRRGRT